MMMAAERKQAEVCSLLIGHKANPLASSIHGRTPLYIAQQTDDPDLLRALEVALWPVRRKRCAPLRGPEAMEVMRLALRQR